MLYVFSINGVELSVRKPTATIDWGEGIGENLPPFGRKHDAEQ
jgi:hypothetical protein